MGGGHIPRYFMNKKEAFVQQAAAMGFDPLNCSEFLTDRGICEMQLNNLMDNMNNPAYVNVLRPPMMAV